MYGFNIIYDNNSLFPLEGNDFIEFKSLKTKLYVSFSCIYFDKFIKDKIFEENENYIFGVDGVILNLQNLKNSYGISDYFKLLTHLWEKKKKFFPNDLKGEFSGFVFDKKSENLFVFCNQTATKPLYYSKCNNSIIISSTISQIIKCKESLNLVNDLNIDAVYSLFTFGGMFEKETLVEGIERLHAGEFISINEDKFEVKSYHSFNDVNVLINEKNKAIDLLEETFSSALDLEYKKDLEYNYSHLATLSGGLDSRMNVMLALQKGYINDVFCFSQSKYLDELIAKQISKDLNLKYHFTALDCGDYFKNISENVCIGRGTFFYLSSAHLNYALNDIDLNDYGLIHTGQIGDAVLGGLISKKSQNFFSKIMSAKLKSKFKRDVSVLDKYSSEETFKLVNRIFNITNSGSFTIENHKTYLVSPFMDVDFITTCLSIAPELKRNANIYLEWIKKHHSEVSKYKWERTGFKPNHYWKTELSRYTNKIKSEYHKFFKQEHKLSMNPLDYWYRNNNSVSLFYSDYYKKNIKNINNPELRNDFELMFINGNVIEKSMVITVLDFINTHNISV